MEDATLALALAKALKESPALDADALGVMFGETSGRVVFVLDEFVVKDGKAEHVGPGGGGPWITDAQRAEIVTAG